MSGYSYACLMVSMLAMFAAWLRVHRMQVESARLVEMCTASQMASMECLARARRAERFALAKAEERS